MSATRNGRTARDIAAYVRLNRTFEPHDLIARWGLSDRAAQTCFQLAADFIGAGARKSAGWYATRVFKVLVEDDGL